MNSLSIKRNCSNFEALEKENIRLRALLENSFKLGETSFNCRIAINQSCAIRTHYGGK